MILEEKYTLSNGIEIPKLGLGTWFINDTDVVRAVVEAAKLGYRHIETAQAYQNERGVGEGIRACGAKREDMFVSTKLAAEVKSYQKAVSKIDESLDAWAVHGWGGIWGALATGLFASIGATGLITGNPGQIWTQTVGIIVVIGYTFVITWIIAKIIDKIMGLRASEDEEYLGIDLASHGEKA